MGKSTKTEIARKLVNFLKDQKQPFYKTQLIDLGMNSRTADEWIELYEIIQSGPKIRKIKLSNNTIYEVIKEKSSDPNNTSE